jgi:hypothetical protein
MMAEPLVRRQQHDHTADYPEQREGQPADEQHHIDNVNRELVPKIRAALGVREYTSRSYIANIAAPI